MHGSRKAFAARGLATLLLAITLASAHAVSAQEPTPEGDGPPPEATVATRPQPAAASHILRFTPKVGALIPRADLKVAFVSLAELDVILPLDPGGNPWVDDRFRIVIESGYALLAQQDETIVPGRGLTNLIQNTHMIPLRLGLTWVFPKDWPARPYLGLAWSGLITRTTFDLGWTTEDQNDVASGITTTLGGEFSFDLAEGVLGVAVLEVQHTEAGAELGELGEVGESTLSATTLVAGFGFEL